MRTSKINKRVVWFLSAFIFGGAFTLTIVISIQYLADPYGILGSPRYQGVNSLKPFLFENSRLAKPRIVERINPQALILGASTSEAGYDPDILEAQGYTSAYNFGIGGGEVYEVFRNYQHVFAVSDPELIIVGLDFMMWVGERPPRRSSFERFLAVNAENQRQDNWKNNWSWLLDPRRLNNGLMTLHFQDASYISSYNFPRHWLRDNGQRQHDSHLRIVDQFGNYLEPFKRQMKEKVRVFTKLDKTDYLGMQPNGGSYLDLLKQMINLAKEKNVRVIFNYPACHISALEIYRKSGVLDMFWAYKLHLASYIKSMSVDADVSLFDFCVYDPLLSEPVFSRVDQTKPVVTFSDAFHFTDHLGDIAMEYMLGLRSSSTGFGVDLISQSDNKNYVLKQEQAYDVVSKMYKAEIQQISKALNNQ